MCVCVCVPARTPVRTCVYVCVCVCVCVVGEGLAVVPPQTGPVLLCTGTTAHPDIPVWPNTGRYCWTLHLCHLLGVGSDSRANANRTDRLGPRAGLLLSAGMDSTAAMPTVWSRALSRGGLLVCAEHFSKFVKKSLPSFEQRRSTHLFVTGHK